MTTGIDNDNDQDVLNIGEQDGASGDEDRGDTITPAPAAGGNDGGDGADSGAVATADGDDDGQEGDGARASQGIPKGRFNEVNAARKAAEARAEAAEQEIARLRAAPPAPVAAPVAAPAQPEFDADAKEQEYMAALLEGDTGKASKVRREINANLVMEATRQAEVQLNQRDAERQVGRVVTESIAAYPWLDRPEGAEAVEMISALRDRMVAQGKPLYQALADAVAKVAPKYAPAQGTDDDTPPRDLSATNKPKDTRPANALARGAADSVAQPPVVQVGIGNRATGARIDVGSLTDEQFAELSDAEKKRLRGD